MRLTHQQNVLMPWIPNERVDALLAEPLSPSSPPPRRSSSAACRPAPARSSAASPRSTPRARAVEIAAFLDEHVRPNGHGEDFRLHFAGCSSSCAQHQIADIGIEGVLKKVDGEFVEAMDIRIGGRLGREPEVRRRRGQEGPALGAQRDAAADLQPLREQHDEGETFRDFAARTEPEWWTSELDARSRR